MVTTCEKAHFLLMLLEMTVYEQIGNKYYPRLYLYYVDADSIKEMQREVLL